MIKFNNNIIEKDINNNIYLAIYKEYKIKYFPYFPGLAFAYKMKNSNCLHFMINSNGEIYII